MHACKHRKKERLCIMQRHSFDLQGQAISAFYLCSYGQFCCFSFWEFTDTKSLFLQVLNHL